MYFICHLRGCAREEDVTLSLCVFRVHGQINGSLLGDEFCKFSKYATSLFLSIIVNTPKAIPVTAPNYSVLLVKHVHVNLILSAKFDSLSSKICNAFMTT